MSSTHLEAYYVLSIETIDKSCDISTTGSKGPFPSFEKAKENLNELKKIDAYKTFVITVIEPHGSNGKIIYLEHKDYCLKENKI